MSADRDGMERPKVSMLLPKHAASLHLMHNDHKSVYETAAQWIEDRESTGGGSLDYVAAGEKERCIATDSIWHLQWYPNTPVAFCDVVSSTLAGLLEWIKENCPDAEVFP